MNNHQEEILVLIYRFRFLTRIQIQKLICQKYYSRLVIWLNDLINKNYLKRFYNSNRINSPIIYSLGNQGRKYLKDKGYKNLDKVWREEKISLGFKYHCLTLADGFLSLDKTIKNSGAELHFYTKNELQNIKYLVIPHPDAYFYIKESDGSKKYYFLDIFDYYVDRQKINKRIQRYLDYFDEAYWQDQTGCPFPEVIFIVSEEKSWSYLNWYLPKVLEDNEEINFYLITKEKMETEGFNKNNLKKIEVED